MRRRYDARHLRAPHRPRPRARAGAQPHGRRDRRLPGRGRRRLRSARSRRSRSSRSRACTCSRTRRGRARAPPTTIPSPRRSSGRRAERLRALSDRLGRERRAARVGRRDHVLVERVDAHGRPARLRCATTPRTRCARMPAPGPATSSRSCWRPRASWRQWGGWRDRPHRQGRQDRHEVGRRRAPRRAAARAVVAARRREGGAAPAHRRGGRRPSCGASSSAAARPPRPTRTPATPIARPPRRARRR